MNSYLYDIFITYANYVFKNDPENIRKLYQVILNYEAQLQEKHRPDAIWPSIVFRVVPSLASEIVNQVITTSKLETRHAVQDYHLSKKKGLYRYPKNLDAYSDPEIPFLTVFGFYEESCDRCRYNEYGDRRNNCIELYGKDLTHSENEPIKCHECDQIDFIMMLSKSVSGKSVKRTGCFYNLSEARNKFVKSMVIIKSIENRDVFKEIKMINISELFSNERNIIPKKFLFSTFMHTIVGYSFFEFMTNEDPLTLKRCGYCEKFFIDKNKRRKYCHQVECQKNRRRKIRKKESPGENDINN